MPSFWSIDGRQSTGLIDSEVFLAALLECFPDATSLVLEGSSIAPNLSACYRRHTESELYIMEVSTIAPVPRRYSCKFSKALVNELIDLAARHAEPELFDHVQLYRGQDELLAWHDAFDNEIIITADLAREMVTKFASRLGKGFEFLSR